MPNSPVPTKCEPAPSRRLLVAAEDDPLFSADRVHCPSDVQRRAEITVAQVEEIAARAAH